MDSLAASSSPPIHELERRQDDVLQQLDDLNAAAELLIEEFNRRLAESSLDVDHDEESQAA